MGLKDNYLHKKRMEKKRDEDLTEDERIEDANDAINFYEKYKDLFEFELFRNFINEVCRKRERELIHHQDAMNLEKPNALIGVAGIRGQKLECSLFICLPRNAKKDAEDAKERKAEILKRREEKEEEEARNE